MEKKEKLNGHLHFSPIRKHRFFSCYSVKFSIVAKVVLPFDPNSAQRNKGVGLAGWRASAGGVGKRVS